MNLILLRHGKAEDSSTIEDARRSLTPDGRRQLRRSLPSLGLLVKNLDQAIVWTSTLDRSIQTAKILARLHDIDDLQPRAFVEDGQYQSLLASLAQEKKTATVVIVGHLPHLTDWCGQLLGSPLAFQKGAAACIKIRSLQPLAAELQWFFQPQALEQFARSIPAKRHFKR